MEFPGDSWSRMSPEESGFDRERFVQAMELARGSDLAIGEDLTVMMPDGTRHPNDRPLGPVKPRGRTSGVVVRSGHIVGEFGDIERAEVTFSVAKSYLSALAGIAWRDGLIDSLDEPVRSRVSGFESDQNRDITWRQLLQQTSEWEGELFGLPDWIDRGRQVSGKAAAREKTIGGSAALADRRELGRPGTFWEYNDVRVNRTALALLQLFSEPLADVLAREIMIPIGASSSWTWHGYSTSWVEVDGRDIESVSGGSHWGGGLWINTLDHARLGLLYLNLGCWQRRQVLPTAWIDATLEPVSLNPAYGLLWWLNADGNIASAADGAAFAARGAGGHIIFVWPARDIVVVLRWCADPGGVIDCVLAALKDESG
jgi:CubicO group peptidase (beta-lactamase class C family)